MSGARDRYDRETKHDRALTIRQVRARLQLQRWTAANVIIRAFTFRGTKRSTSFGRAVMELAAAEGLKWRDGRLIW